MRSGCDIKKFILEKTVEYIKEMPNDVYALYFFINTQEGTAQVPTLALMYNTLSELGEDIPKPIEPCWNIAFWYTDECPIIGNNAEDTNEAKKTMNMLSEWFSVNGYDSAQIEDDPNDDYFECTMGYRILSEMIEEIAPDLKKVFKDKFGRDIVLLLGEYSYTPVDVKKISAINGNAAQIFLEYYEEMTDLSEDFNTALLDSLGDNDDQNYDKVVLEFLKKIKEDYKS